MQKQLSSLIKDTLIYLRDEKKSFVYLQDASLEFFQQYLKEKETKRICKKPKPAAVFSAAVPAVFYPEKKAVLSKPAVVKDEKPTGKKDFREPEKPVCHLTLAFGHFQELMQKIDPRIKITDQIPDDAEAREIASSWKMKSKVGKVTLLAFQETKKELFFLKELAKAIHLLFQPAKIISAVNLEKDNQWEAFLSQPHLKLLIITDVSLWKLRNLSSHYHENPASGEAFLGPAPVLLLPQPSLYLKEPQLKKNLYENLKKKIHSLNFS